jgi:3-oxoacyl-[acyl-carrier protein] reductase
MARTILITGASTGIGAATAIRLAEGNKILLHFNQSKKEAEKVAKGISEIGGEVYPIQADLMNEIGCRQLFEQVEKSTNHLDVLVNNAGGLLTRHAVNNLTWNLMHEIFALNTFSTMMITTLCIPLLDKGNDPSIINITSIAMRNGGPTATVYGAAKGALDSFTRGAARELAPRIRVNAVAPGVIDTPYHQKFTPPELLDKFKNDIPLGRVGLDTQIARTISFLIENSFMTGETIDVNGGQFMR